MNHEATIATLNMQLDNCAKDLYEKDKRIADLERQLADAAPPACLIEPVVMPQKVHVHHIAAIAKCSGIFGLVSMSEIQKFALALLNEFSTAEASAPAVEQQPVAWAIFNADGGIRIWFGSHANALRWVSSQQLSGHELKPLYTAPLAADTDKVREALPGWERGIATVTMNGHQLREALNFINPDGPGDELQCEDELTFGIVQHKDDDGKVSTGLCCWNDDTDGVYPLDGEPAPAASMAAQAPVREVPGYKLVPIEPTQEMLDEIVGYCVEEKLLKKRYAAMLSAAPLPAAPAQQEGEKP